MIKTLTLKNFRQHGDLHLSFEEGLNVIRGSNESGKTTLLEALSYLWFGSKALRNTFADCVTWGAPETSLRVTGEFFINGKHFLAIRHKGGAEVYVNGGTEPYITGQNDVSKFWAQELGANLDRMNQLIFSAQGKLKGALEMKGSTGTQELIERLANFDIFDFVLEQLNNTLVLGNTRMQQDEIAQIEETLTEGGQDWDSQIQVLISEVATLDSLQKVESEKTTEITQEQHKIAEQVATLERNRTQALGAIEAVEVAKAKVDELEEPIATTKAASELELRDVGKWDALIREADSYAFRKRTHDRMSDFIRRIPEQVWGAPLDSFLPSLAEAKDKHSSLVQKYNLMASEIDRGRRDKLDGTHCPMCKQELANAEEIAKHNAQRLKELEAKEAEHKVLRQEVDEAEVMLKVLSGLQELQTEAEHLAESSPDLIQLDPSSVPNTPKWIAEPLSDAPGNVVELQASRKVDMEFNSTVSEARSRLPTLQEMLADRVRILEEAQATVAALGVAEGTDEALEALRQRLGEVSTRLVEHNANLKQIAAQHTEAVSRLARTQERALADKSRIEDLNKRLDTLKNNVKEVEFNNKLVQKLRDMRPVITDRLWNIVLSTVSEVFSETRCEPSVVTKDRDGFKVNGHAVSSLSGSALDVLGAAIRNALIRTFIPGTSMVIFDEPFAAMDDNRTMEMLNFISQSGFAQTLLVTHEDISETLADHRIEL